MYRRALHPADLLERQTIDEEFPREHMNLRGSYANSCMGAVVFPYVDLGVPLAPSLKGLVVLR